MATIKVQGKLEVGSVVMDNWEIHSKGPEVNFEYKNDNIATLKADETIHVPTDVPQPAVNNIHKS